MKATRTAPVESKNQPRNAVSESVFVSDDAHSITIDFYMDTDITGNRTPPILLLDNLESALTGVLLASRFLNTNVSIDLGGDIHKGFNEVLFNIFSGALLGFYPFAALNHERIEGSGNELIPLSNMFLDGLYVRESSLADTKSDYIPYLLKPVLESNVLRVSMRRVEILDNYSTLIFTILHVLVTTCIKVAGFLFGSDKTNYPDYVVSSEQRQVHRNAWSQVSSFDDRPDFDETDSISWLYVELEYLNRFKGVLTETTRLGANAGIIDRNTVLEIAKLCGSWCRTAIEVMLFKYQESLKSGY